jgi:hypothetical protein
MNINELFPSKYAQPEDLKGRTVLGTINTVNLVSTHNPSVKMPVITFLSAKKPIILKQTLANDIAKIHGPETDNWKAQKIMLYTETIKGRLLFRAREIKPHEMPGYTRPENHRPISPATAMSAFTPNQTPDEQEAEQLASDARKASIEAAGLTEAVKTAQAKGAKVA